jgi:DNA-binding MurR/RpiR family transcriptional regulator
MMFGRDKQRRQQERDRRAVLAAVVYLEAGIRDDQRAIDAAVSQVDPGALQAAVVQLAQRAIVVIAEAKGILAADAAAELGDDLIAELSSET